MRFYRYKKRRFPIGWDCFNMNTWSKPGIPMEFSRCVMDEMPHQVDDLGSDLPIFRCLRDEGVDLSDFYEYQGEPRTFNIWPPETKDKPLAEKMEDVVGMLMSSKRPECEHEDIKDNVCQGCGIVFIVCGPCTEAGGAGLAVTHTPPACSGEPA